MTLNTCNLMVDLLTDHLLTSNNYTLSIGKHANEMIHYERDAKLLLTCAI
jgi:hypothetical protein